ncbi:tetratricopeptide repeat-containing sulfotransferase family protein [Pseudoalteromonas denitrificans]|uniref:Sulfotransferase domain-containing protein n=1 Tax=Pseudoalteromonas denitrificans DSM 6059 TaxID=1123010 RepID=A0A1I1I0U5_9GAMM|nr:sulfotransferase [Pseudoalteromonas denitrificans]SFC29711.1 Sulfotransferase domain-containing protein [Pseudoalteromonas denitrificans DSM 6059]
MIHSSHNSQNLLKQCKALLDNGELLKAQSIVKQVLINSKNDVTAIEIAFEIAIRFQDFKMAENYYNKYKIHSQNIAKQQLLYITLLETKEEHFKALDQIDSYLSEHGVNLDLLYKHGLISVKAGRILQAEQSFLNCIDNHYSNEYLTLNLGHVYKAKGDSKLASHFYKKFIAEGNHVYGVGYWSLADLKDYRFSIDDIEHMQSLIEDPSISISNAALLLFAIAKAHEQEKEFNLAFDAMNKANSIIEKHKPFKAELFTNLIKNMISDTKAIQTSSPSDKSFTPIFIVGMPRSGTTLVEQIIASHTEVESTDELQYIERIALELEMSGGYTKQINELDESKKLQLSTQYKIQIQQYFNQYQAITIDKNPNNYLHIGLIKKLFPNAKIINVIRNPLDNALSVFKQYFYNGHDYSYSIKNIIHYWQGYIVLMLHWKKLFGSEIMHLSYEQLTQEPEAEIRRILKYCELGFEPQCLTFYNSDRIVLTPSVSQVKQPINNRSVGSWKKYQNQMSPFISDFKDLIKKTNLLFD